MPRSTKVERVNILFLDKDPVRAAVMLADRDVISQPQEVVQILASVCCLNGVKRVPYKLTHAKHPTVVWAGSTAENFEWVWKHLCALLFEYERRYGRPQLMTQLKHHEFMYDEMPDLPDNGLTAFPKVFHGLGYEKIKNPVEAYQAYYADSRRGGNYAWRLHNAPDWYRELVQQAPHINLSKDEEDLDEDLE